MIAVNNFILVKSQKDWLFETLDLGNDSLFIFRFIFSLLDPGKIDTTTQTEDSNCPPDKLRDNMCEKWRDYGMCSGTWMEENCATSCMAC